MKVVTANRLTDGRVIYVAADGGAVDDVSLAAVLQTAEAEAALALAAARPDVFVNPYLVETDHGVFTGRDRLKETIRAAGPTVGNSLKHEPA